MGGFVISEEKVVLLASFLHDVGKFVQRVMFESGGRPDKRHEEFSRFFFEDTGLKSTPLFEGVYNKVLDLIERHHDVHGSNGLLRYVIEGDHLSSSEREYELKEDSHVNWSDIVNSRLINSFSVSENDSRELALSPLGYDDRLRYFWRVRGEMGTYRLLYGEFKKFLSNKVGYIGTVGTLDFVLLKFLWSVPSAIFSWEGKIVPTISLYQHMKLAAAFAYSLYKSGDKVEPFLVVKGDLMGIQEFIGRVSRAGEPSAKGVAKRLRGRSSFIEVLGFFVAYSFLEALGLETINLVYVSGGEFLAIVPNSEEVVGKLKRFSENVNRFLFGLSRGQLKFALAHVKLGKNLSGGVIAEKYYELAENLEREKLRLYHWDAGDILRVKTPYSYSNSRICRACGVMEADIEEYIKIKPRNGDADGLGGLCRFCASLQEFGRKIVDATHLLILKVKKQALENLQMSKSREAYISRTLEDLYVFGYVMGSMVYLPNEISIDLGGDYATIFMLVLKDDGKSGKSVGEKLKSLKDLFGGDLVKIYSLAINDTNGFIYGIEGINVENIVYGFVFMNNFAPRKEENKKKEIKSFEEIADGQPLAYVKADIDYIGLVFSKSKTFSEFATKSMLIELFFAAHVKELLESEYKDIYVVYSGGDDLFFIGQWERAVNALLGIYEDLHKFAGKGLTMSSAIVLFKHNYPVHIANRIITSKLKLAKPTIKDEEGGYIYFFDELAKWSDVKNLVEFAKEYLLDKSDNSKSILSRSLLFRLLNIRRSMLKYNYEKREVESIHSTWQATLIYMLREYLERDKIKETANKILDRFLKDENDFRLISIPLNYAILKTRKIKGGDENE